MESRVGVRPEQMHWTEDIMNIQTPIKTSLRKRVWQEPQITDAQVQSLIEAGANALTAPVLAARDMAPDEVAAFLSPTIRSLLPNPSFFIDMDKAADRLTKAIIDGEKVAIWSDYDVDGATSAATLGRFLRDCGRPDFDLYIPDRIHEGYGPNADGLLGLQKNGAELVCILDSGTMAHEPLEAAQKAGLDVVVIDHHTAEEKIPPAVALVNPNRLDQAEGYGHVCAAGMTFIFCIAVNLRLRKANWYDGQEGRPAAAPDLMSYLDLVALGTICDVVPLKTINRAFVMRGLPYLSERRLPGIKALAEISGSAEEIDPGACGFNLGPRINAGGRIGDSTSGATLLLCQDGEEAAAMAEHLNDLNTERKEMERACTEQALEQVLGSQSAEQEPFIPGTTRRLAFAIVDAHEGIVGISAARLKDATDAPAFVVAPTPEGWLKGSGRSVPGFNLGDAIIEAGKQGITVKGGGHAMAGGLTLEPDKVDAFIDFVNGVIDDSEYAVTGVTTKVDTVININQATTGMCDAMQSLAPFGMGNPTPRVVLSGTILSDVRILKEKHIKCIFEDPELGPAGPRIEGLIWNAVGTPFGDALMDAKDQVVDVLGALEINEWMGRRKVQMKLEDVRLTQ
jgi:single-stranded-DNA-specific exonuclease